MHSLASLEMYKNCLAKIRDNGDTTLTPSRREMKMVVDAIVEQLRNEALKKYYAGHSLTEEEYAVYESILPTDVREDLLTFFLTDQYIEKPVVLADIPLMVRSLSPGHIFRIIRRRKQSVGDLAATEASRELTEVMA